MVNVNKCPTSNLAKDRIAVAVPLRVGNLDHHLQLTGKIKNVSLRFTLYNLYVGCTEYGALVLRCVDRFRRQAQWISSGLVWEFGHFDDSLSQEEIR